MDWIVVIIVSILSGTAASLGLGGGFVLLIYLTCFAGVSQMQAQGINLLFFIPIAAAAVIMHKKNKLLDYKIIVPASLTGIVGSIGGAFIAKSFDPALLSKIFAVFILFFGVKEIFHRKNKTSKKSINLK